jgi:hypothetical protein
MKNARKLAITASLAVLAPPALARHDGYVSQPLPLPTDEVRKGDLNIKTIVRKSPATGALIFITPLPHAYGHIVFSVMVTNQGATPIQFGRDTITASAAGQLVALMTRDQMGDLARHDYYSQLGNIAGDALEANTYTYSHTTSGHVGGEKFSVTSSGTFIDHAGEEYYAASRDAIADHDFGTHIAVAHQILTDTKPVMHNTSASGLIALDKLKSKVWPVVVTITVNGEPFHFSVSRY